MNALAEAINGLYKAEIIHSRQVWASGTAVEMTTMDWVQWWNTRRLHESLDYRTPAEDEATYTQDLTLKPAVV
ncbi:transposase [Citricoccus nitrophenolicus]